MNKLQAFLKFMTHDTKKMTPEEKIECLEDAALPIAGMLLAAGAFFQIIGFGLAYISLIIWMFALEFVVYECKQEIWHRKNGQNTG
jgi:hypothetical protein